MEMFNSEDRLHAGRQTADIKKAAICEEKAASGASTLTTNVNAIIGEKAGKVKDLAVKSREVVKGDTRVAVAFLKKWNPNGLWALTSIIPDGKTTTATFEAAKWTEAANWIEHRQGKQNIYFHVNPTLKPLDKKAKKEDIAQMAWLHIDIDPRVGEEFEEERKRALKLLQEYSPAPTVIVDSGGGYQGFWKLKASDKLVTGGSVEKAQELEAYNVQLEKIFSADNCHNIDRIMRLPGTVNLPNEKKRKKGRKPVLSELISFTDSVYPIDAFVPAARALALSFGKERRFSFEELDEYATASPHYGEGKCILMTGKHPWDEQRYSSGTDGSAALRGAALLLLKAGIEPSIVALSFFSPGVASPIVANIAKSKNHYQYVCNEVTKAQKKIDEGWVDNQKPEGKIPNWDRVNKAGEPLPSYWNTRTALQIMGLDCSFDQFRSRHIIGDSHVLQEFAGDFSDHAIRILRDEIIRQYNFDPGETHPKNAVLSLCTENRFDSLINHLNTLPQWDGIPRLDTWLVDYLGVENSPYTREAGAAWLTAAVVRAFEPGRKFDYMLVLMGRQGVGKSTALRIIAGDEFFSDASFLHARDSREILEVTGGVWILECAELDGIGKKDIGTLKAMISKQKDTARAAYAQTAGTVLRRFVLGGTTNEERFLQDPNENRRYWPVTVTQVKLERLKADRDQLIAEALARYRSGNYRLILGVEAETGAKLAQAQRRVIDEGFKEQLEGLRPEKEKWNGKFIVTNESVYERLGIPTERRNGNVPGKVKAVMTELGWRPYCHTVRLEPGKVQRIYIWAGEGEPLTHETEVKSPF